MKKTLLILAFTLYMVNVNAQEKLFLVFEFMQVDNNQEEAYWETEDFWQKIHQERVKNGDIIGWDLWSLQPGGEKQFFQYLTVTLYNDPVKMMSTSGDFGKALKQAYPEINEGELEEKFRKTANSRDLEVRLFLEQISVTEGENKMPLGTIAQMDMMKAIEGKYWDYEQAEKETFKKMHQEQVENGNKEYWGLLRVMSPTGSDTYASHITTSMYNDYKQFFSENPKGKEFSEEEIKSFKKGLKTRDLKYTFMATLVKKIR